MLFDPPAALCGSALVQLGVDAQQLLVVHGREGARAAAGLRRLLPSADLLWALEQALKSGHVGAVLAWLPQRLKADALRRLQLAAQSHDGPAFLFREVDARVKPSAAPLRLLLQGAGIDRLSVRVLKRRGPPLARPLMLALPPILSERLRARARGESDAGDGRCGCRAGRANIRRRRLRWSAWPHAVDRRAPAAVVAGVVCRDGGSGLARPPAGADRSPPHHASRRACCGAGHPARRQTRHCARAGERPGARRGRRGA